MLKVVKIKTLMGATPYKVSQAIQTKKRIQPQLYPSKTMSQLVLMSFIYNIGIIKDTIIFFWLPKQNSNLYLFGLTVLRITNYATRQFGNLYWNWTNDDGVKVRCFTIKLTGDYGGSGRIWTHAWYHYHLTVFKTVLLTRLEYASIWYKRLELNQWHEELQSSALPTELHLYFGTWGRSRTYVVSYMVDLQSTAFATQLTHAYLVWKEGLEPSCHKTMDFKSTMYANSTTLTFGTERKI